MASLRALVRKEMLTLDADPRSPERGQYGLVQGLIREVAYSTLARADRRSKHLAVAHHFESIDDDEFAGAVAAHYLEAYRASPDGPEADAVAARARDWLSQAGERALSLGSPEQGLAFLEQALAITVEGPERAALLERAGEAASRAASFERAVSLLDEAAAHYERAGDAAAAGVATAKTAWPLHNSQRYAEAVERCEKAYAALGPEGNERARAELEVALTFTLNLWANGSGEQALAWAEIAAPLAERLDVPQLLGEAIGSKAGVLFDLGRHREAAMLARGAFDLAKAAGSTIDQARALLTLSLYVQDEDLRRSMTLALEAAGLARRAGDRVMETTNLLNASEIATFLGEWKQADDVMAQAKELVGREVRPWADLINATLKAVRGETEESASILDGLAPTYDATEFLQLRTTFLRARSLVYLAAGNLEDSRRSAAAAVAEDPSGINSALALAIQARAALWLRDTDGAEEALRGMESFRGRWTGAARETTRAGLAALRGTNGRGVPTTKIDETGRPGRRGPGAGGCVRARPGRERGRPPGRPRNRDKLARAGRRAPHSPGREGPIAEVASPSRRGSRPRLEGRSFASTPTLSVRVAPGLGRTVRQRGSRSGMWDPQRTRQLWAWGSGRPWVAAGTRFPAPATR